MQSCLAGKPCEEIINCTSYRVLKDVGVEIENKTLTVIALEIYALIIYKRQIKREKRKNVKRIYPSISLYNRFPGGLLIKIGAFIAMINKAYHSESVKLTGDVLFGMSENSTFSFAIIGAFWIGVDNPVSPALFPAQKVNYSSLFPAQKVKFIYN